MSLAKAVTDAFTRNMRGEGFTCCTLLNALKPIVAKPGKCIGWWYGRDCNGPVFDYVLEAYRGKG